MRDQENIAKPPVSRRRGGQNFEIFRPEGCAELTTPAPLFFEASPYRARALRRHPSSERRGMD
jgi:hypothetical protein